MSRVPGHGAPHVGRRVGNPRIHFDVFLVSSQKKERNSTTTPEAKEDEDEEEEDEDEEGEDEDEEEEDENGGDKDKDENVGENVAGDTNMKRLRLQMTP